MLSLNEYDIAKVPEEVVFELSWDPLRLNSRLLINNLWAKHVRRNWLLVLIEKVTLGELVLAQVNGILVEVGMIEFLAHL